MKNRHFRLGLIISLPLLFIVIGSCREELETGDKQSLDENVESVAGLKAAADLPGRHLAANCFQCHGTNGHAGELKIAGQGAGGMIDKLNEYKSKDPRSNIMHVHAAGYTPEEIKLIAEYFSKQ